MPEEVYHQAFSARLDALAAIHARDHAAAEKAAEILLGLGKIYGRNSPGADLVGFAVALSCVALHWKWREAVRDAEPDSIRFLKAAQLQAVEHLQSANENSFDQIVSELVEVETTQALAEVETKLVSTPMPFSIKTPDKGFRFPEQTGKKVHQKKTEIAFVKFEINGDPAKTIDSLAPNFAHDMVLHLRVRNWPEDADRLIVEPVSAEPVDCYELPKFVLERPKDPTGNIIFEKRGRLILKFAQPLGARPLEFKYRAVFDPKQAGFIDLLGHRTLKLESLDPSGTALSGYPGLDSKILEIRKTLMRIPGIPESDIVACMLLLSSLANMAGQALQSSLFATGTTESQFQTEMVKHLRSNPNIGSQLEEHPHSGGGVVDLSYRQIRLELKVDSDSALTEHKISKFCDQTAHYVVTSGKRIGILCILDASKRTGPPKPAESLLSVTIKHESHATVPIVVLVIQGGLARPSDLSR